MQQSAFEHAALIWTRPSNTMPLTFSLDHDPGAVDQQVQRPLRAAIWNVHRQSFLATRQRAEVGDSPRPTKRDKLSTKPVVCLSAIPNSTFIVRQVWMMLSL